MASDDFQIGVARRSHHRGRRAAFVAVNLAGEQRTQRNDVVLEMGKLELDTLLHGEARAHRHHLKAGVALGLDDRVSPWLRTGLLRQTGCIQRNESGHGGKTCAGDPQPSDVGHLCLTSIRNRESLSI